MQQNIFALNYKSKTFGYIAADILILCFIYLIPSLSHLTSVPLYLYDPMRLALVFCIIYTNRKNSLIVALTIPLVSILISSHPVFIKGVLITAELVVNVLAFYIITKRFRNLFIVMFTSILIAKTFYYSVKIILLNSGLLQGDLFSTPLWIQFMMMILLSVMTFIVLRKSA